MGDQKVYTSVPCDADDCRENKGSCALLTLGTVSNSDIGTTCRQSADSVGPVLSLVYDVLLRYVASTPGAVTPFHPHNRSLRQDEQRKFATGGNVVTVYCGVESTGNKERSIRLGAVLFCTTVSTAPCRAHPPTPGLGARFCVRGLNATQVPQSRFSDLREENMRRGRRAR